MAEQPQVLKPPPEVLKPPPTEVGVLGWLRKNLFSTWYNILLTILAGGFLYVVLRAVITWVVLEARWAVVTVNLKVFAIGRYPGDQAWRVLASLGIILILAALTWVVRGLLRRQIPWWLVTAWLFSFPLIAILLRGIDYPTDEAWRILVSLGLTALLTVLIGLWQRGDGQTPLWLVIVWLLSFPLIGFLLRGIGYLAANIWHILGWIVLLAVLAVLAWNLWRRSGQLPLWLVVTLLLSLVLISLLLRKVFQGTPILEAVPEDVWSGLLLTLVLAVVGIVASFPLGVLLALGRRSNLPVIKVLCTFYIETIRGVPLISVLFMSQLMLPLFLPQGIRLGTVMRALTGMTLFSAAYTAENVRGGLAAIPIGQYEAGRAVGLSEPLVMTLIILPQALRNVIPAIVGQFISLFKDTSLVVIVGLLDLLGIAKAVTGQREFIGLHMEAYSFAALVYFVCCFAMSNASRRLERALGVGER